ncbi:MAG: transposase [Bacteroidota bacterium]
MTFSYKQHGNNRIRTMALGVREFIRRFLQHVLPYGFMHSACKIPIPDIRAIICGGAKEEHSDSIPEPSESGAAVLYCPDCGGLANGQAKEASFGTRDKNIPCQHIEKVCSCCQ